MSLTSQLLIAWFGVNLLILALMWHSAEVRRRRRAEYERQHGLSLDTTPPPATPNTPAHTPAHTPPAEPMAQESSRVIALVTGEAAGTALHRQAPAAGCNGDCDCEALRAEVRSLRLSVAELSIDRACLLAKLQPSPWKRPPHSAPRQQATP